MSRTRVNAEDSIGKTFGRMYVVGITRDGRSRAHAKCRCECGNEKEVCLCSLRAGLTKSCGCLFREAVTKHGEFSGNGKKRTAEYHSWMAMKGRCRYDSKGSERYKDRGIEVCERWNEFENFLFDMGRKPSSRHSIDRINNDLGYSKENCRWATPSQQARNTSVTVSLELGGRIQSKADWCDELGLNFNTVSGRIFRGWSVERALSK